MISLRKAVEMAPSWATHISIRKDNNQPEFYNRVTVKGVSSGQIERGSTESPMGYDAFFERLLNNKTQWRLYRIPKNLENK